MGTRTTIEIETISLKVNALRMARIFMADYSEYKVDGNRVATRTERDETHIPLALFQYIRLL
ncbi:hypothetical protein D779_0559 [Imhoffiella purpurea]|uniref:Uncharacterized protein n=1 Tax=Imhoffiella purpurea TaxID=1249627 RepID=W9W0D5_9GAMM|nr:hypothetical protein D779_0559 [Imhoffiella purpurea]